MPELDEVLSEFLHPLLPLPCNVCISVTSECHHGAMLLHLLDPMLLSSYDLNNEIKIDEICAET